MIIFEEAAIKGCFTILEDHGGGMVRVLGYRSLRWALVAALLVQSFVLANTISSYAATASFMDAVHANADHSSHNMPMGGHEQGGPDCQMWCAVQAGVNGSNCAVPQSMSEYALYRRGADPISDAAQRPRGQPNTLEPPPPRH